MNKTRFPAIGILGLAMAVFLLTPAAQGWCQKQEPPKILVQDSYHGIPYLSGGVGIGQREKLREMHKNYDLKLVFAVENGDYLADVKVVMKNEKGETVLDVNSPGPWFYTKLAPGKYNLTATAQDKTVEEPVHVSTTGMTELIVYWK